MLPVFKLFGNVGREKLLVMVLCISICRGDGEVAGMSESFITLS
jgi:hypothetical protein